MRTINRERDVAPPPAAPPSSTPPDPSQKPVEPGRIYLALLLCILVAAVLTTGRLAGIARTQPPGPERQTATGLMEPLDRLAGLVGLSLPAALVDRALGRDDEAIAVALPPAPVGTVSPGPGVPPVATATTALAAPSPLPSVQPTAAATAPTPVVVASPVATTASAPQATTSVPATATTAPVAQPTATTAPPTATRPPNSPTPQPQPTSVPAPAADAGGRRAVSADAPLRVLVAGDSLAQPLGYDIGEFGQKSKHLDTKTDTKISSGIALPEYFNWPNRLNQLFAAKPQPEVVVLFLGANDFKVMTVNGKKVEQLTPPWRVEYARRAGEVMDLVGERQARLYWVGMPVVREAWHNDVFRDINAAVAQEAAKRPWVTFVDTVPLFADANGKFATYRPNARGEMVKVRQDDGIHLTDTGTSWVSQRVYDLLRRDWKLPAVS